MLRRPRTISAELLNGTSEEIDLTVRCCGEIWKIYKYPDELLCTVIELIATDFFSFKRTSALHGLG
jgi:hypothetical protein